MMDTAAARRASPKPEAVLAKAALRAAEALGIPNARLAAILGTSEASVSRMSRGRGIDPDGKEGELAAIFLRAFRSLDAIVGGNGEQARAWFEAPNDHLGGVPAERVTTVEGLVDVVQYLDAMRGRL